MRTATRSHSSPLKPTPPLIIKTLCKGEFGGNIISQELGKACMAQQSLLLPSHVANRTSVQFLQPNLSAENSDLVLGQVLFVHCKLEERMTTKMTSRLYSLCTGMCTLLKSNIVMTQPEQQLARATEQHIELKHVFAQCH